MDMPVIVTTSEVPGESLDAQETDQVTIGIEEIIISPSTKSGTSSESPVSDTTLNLWNPERPQPEGVKRLSESSFPGLPAPSGGSASYGGDTASIGNVSDTKHFKIDEEAGETRPKPAKNVESRGRETITGASEPGDIGDGTHKSANVTLVSIPGPLRRSEHMEETSEKEGTYPPFAGHHEGSANEAKGAERNSHGDKGSESGKGEESKSPADKVAASGFDPDRESNEVTIDGSKGKKTDRKDTESASYPYKGMNNDTDTNSRKHAEVNSRRRKKTERRTTQTDSRPWYSRVGSSLVSIPGKAIRWAKKHPTASLGIVGGAAVLGFATLLRPQLLSTIGIVGDNVTTTALEQVGSIPVYRPSEFQDHGGTVMDIDVGELYPAPGHVVITDDSGSV